MTSEQLAAVAGVLLSLAFSYVPGLADKFAVLTSVQKSLIMLGLMFVVGAGALGLSCANVVVSIECTKDGLMTLINSFVAAAVANQVTYSFSPTTARVKAAKAAQAK